jgi:hypothetical protein
MITIQIPSTLADSLQQAAAAHGTTAERFCVSTLRRFLEQERSRETLMHHIEAEARRLSREETVESSEEFRPSGSEILPND